MPNTISDQLLACLTPHEDGGLTEAQVAAFLELFEVRVSLSALATATVCSCLMRPPCVHASRWRACAVSSPCSTCSPSTHARTHARIHAQAGVTEDELEQAKRLARDTSTLGVFVCVRAFARA